VTLPDLLLNGLFTMEIASFTTLGPAGFTKNKEDPF
jgi:hypothetical protein